jgi:hypothetical protein
MLPAMLQLMMPLHGQAAAPLPVWSVDPSAPGADAPSVGTSLFDAVTTKEGRQAIPFPFEKLISGLEAAAGCERRPACTRAILLPLGRSLQRVAASPDFFAHPRVVAAVVDDGKGRLLRDRLYLGYQDKAGVIEVISYNETLGRFEFQVVRNYQAGQVPQVSYARRAVCVSCHQNHGPMFSRQVWLETNANPQIAARLEARGATFHGVAARGTLDTANAIDDATDRSNRLALVQKLWRQGCGEGVEGERCRRAAFIAALQFVLTGGRAYSADVSFQRDVIDRLQANAQLQWPAGIAIPDADLVNRDPLAVPSNSDPLVLVHVPARFDPLTPRVPAEIVAPYGKVLADELVRGVASFASSAQRDDLDRAIRQRGRGAAVRDIEVPCEIDAVGDRIAFGCGTPSDLEVVSSSFQLKGTLTRADGLLDAIAVDRGPVVRHLQLRSVARTSGATHRSLSVEVHDQGRTARLPDGNAISSIVLKWSVADTQRVEAKATLRVRQDFAVASALVHIGSEPVRTATIDDFTSKVRGEARRDTAQPITITAKRLDDDTAVAKPAAVFEPECGNCHHTDEITPPNFLTGDARRVTDALNSCAPRILVRLAMQDVPAVERDKSPMPPEPVLLPGQQSSAHNTRKSASISAVRRDIEERLRTEYGRVPTVTELLKNGYENLRPCLPASG